MKPAVLPPPRHRIALPPKLLEAREHFQSGRHALAASLYKQVIDDEPNNGALRGEVMAFCVAIKDYPLAVIHGEAAVASPWGSDKPELWHQLGIALASVREFERAEHAHAVAFTLDPDHLLALASAAVHAAQAGDLTLAHLRFQRAMEIEPKTHEERNAVAQLFALYGDYAKAWPPWESRRFVKQHWGHGHEDVPIWTGQPMKGKTLVVIGEGGLGDEIMFARFLPALLSRVDGPVVLMVKPQNVELFRGYPGLADVWSREGVWPKAGRQTRMFSLPLRLGMRTPDTWPHPGFAIRPDIPLWEKARGEKLVIGFCHQGGTAHENDYDRSCPDRATMEAPIREAFPDAELRNFTFGDADYAGGKEWADTGRALRDIDLLVSVDTALVHFACSLGVPTVMVQPSVPEWRWGFHNENPWYPGVLSVTRKPDLYRWDEAMEDVIELAQKRLGMVPQGTRSVLLQNAMV